MKDLAVGTHLTCTRYRFGLPAYTHHGFYLGDGSVIHYAGLSDDPTAEGSHVQLTTLESFAAGDVIEIATHPEAKFSGEEVAERAVSRLGEDGYSVANNNCEHFCNWAIYGDHCSPQVNRGATITSVAAFVPGRMGILAVTALGGASGLAGSAAMMKGMAMLGGGVIGGLGTAALTLGLGSAFAINKNLLAENAHHSEEEAEARRIGRVASVVSAAGTTLLTIGTVSAAGCVSGLSAAGITSGLAAIGGTIGGGMASGIAIGMAAPAAAAVGVGYGTYKLVQNNDQVREAIADTGTRAAKLASEASDATKRVAETITPIAQQAVDFAAGIAKERATELADIAASSTLEEAKQRVAQLAKGGLLVAVSAIEAGTAKIKGKLDSRGSS